MRKVSCFFGLTLMVALLVNSTLGWAGAVNVGVFSSIKCGFIVTSEMPQYDGAKADGVTDDTAAIVKFTGRLKNGSHARFPAGTYICANNAITLSGKNGVIFEGYGAVLKQPSPAPSQYFVFNITNCPGITIKGFTFERRNSYESGKEESAIFITGSSNASIIECVFNDCYRGVYLEDSPYFLVSNCRGTGVSPYVYASPLDPNKIMSHELVFVVDKTTPVSTGGRIIGNYCYLYTALVYNEDGNNCTISGNVIDLGSDGVYTKASGNTISNNVVNSPAKDGIKVLANTGGEKTVVVGNVVRKPGRVNPNGGNGIQVTGSNFSVTGNYIELDDPANLATTNTRGIIWEGLNFSIVGNTITGPGQVSGVSGISNIHDSSIYAGAQGYALISGNKINDVYTGIVLLSSSSYVTSNLVISDNFISSARDGISNEGNSIAAAQTSAVFVRDNTLLVSHYGVVLDHVASGQVVGNYLSGPGASYRGIYLNAVAACEVRDNDVRSFLTGVYVDATSTSIYTKGQIFTSITNRYIWNGSSARVDRDNPSGTSAQRPALATDDVGYRYFDTTLGKPVFWNGTVWKLADGTTA